MSTKDFIKPNFYVVSDRMNYTIRGEVCLLEHVDGVILQHAVDKAFQRYPYFSVQVVKEGESYVLKDNPRPHNVWFGNDKVLLGSKSVNYHLVVVSYYENKIVFNVSHCITDGAGRAPLTKTVLYYYLNERYGINLDPTGINLAGDPLHDDELTLPISLEEIMEADDTYFRPLGNPYKLTDGTKIHDREQREFRFMVEEQEFMRLNKSSDASPSVLASALLSQITWELNDNVDKDIVVNLCLNMRPGLGSKYNHWPMFACIPLTYKPVMKDYPLEKICTCSRGMVMIQSQPENVQFLCKGAVQGMEAIESLPDLDSKIKVCSQSVYAPGGLMTATYIVSYVGKNNLGSLSPYIMAMFTTVDAIPSGGVIIEITSADNKFYFTFMQDFSTDVYYKAFIKKLTDNNVKVTELGDNAIMAPRILLP